MDIITIDGIRPVLDVLIHIASFNEETWIKLYLYDDEFNLYARTNIGINKCIQSFWKTMNTIDLPMYKSISWNWNVVSLFWKTGNTTVGEKVKTIFGKLLRACHYMTARRVSMMKIRNISNGS